MSEADAASKRDYFHDWYEFVFFFPLLEGRLRVNYPFGNSRIHTTRQRSKEILLRRLHLLNKKLRPNKFKADWEFVYRKYRNRNLILG